MDLHGKINPGKAHFLMSPLKTALSVGHEGKRRLLCNFWVKCKEKCDVFYQLPSNPGAVTLVHPLLSSLFTCLFIYLDRQLFSIPLDPHSHNFSRSSAGGSSDIPAFGNS